MNIIRSVAILAAGGAILVGCGSGNDRTARLEAEVAALKSQVTATSEPTTTTTTASPTTTTLAPTTSTTEKKVVTTTTTKPVATTTTTVAPWCTASAVPASTTKGQLVTILITSNLPGRATTIGLRPGPTMDPRGSGTHTLTAGGPNMNEYGHYSPSTNNVEVKFYSQPVTLGQMVDGPRPPVLTACSTKYVSMP